jgi:hypothetical protein
MSGGRVFQQALRVLDGMYLPPEATSDLLAVLEAARREGQPGQLLYECGVAAGLSGTQLLERCAALYLLVAAVNLCDDQIDGDVDYLDPADRLAPSSQALLLLLAFSELLRAGLPAVTVAEAQRAFARVASFPNVEVRTREWDLARYQLMAEETGGRQWATYLQILWAGTPLEALAEPFALNGAVAAYVGEDLRVSDVRLTSLPPEDQRTVLAWTRTKLQALTDMKLRPGDILSQSILPLLDAAEAQLGGA